MPGINYKLLYTNFYTTILCFYKVDKTDLPSLGRTDGLILAELLIVLTLKHPDFLVLVVY